jgi:hypothetical protein
MRKKKKWISYQNGEKIKYIINNKDTIEYFAEVIESRKNRDQGSYRGRDVKVLLKYININPIPESLQYLEYEINSDSFSGTKNRSSLHALSTNESLIPDSNVVINGISYPVYNFLYDNKYHYLEKVTFSKDLGYLYVRDTAGNFITYLNKIQ